MECPECGVENLEENIFCSGCGERLAIVPSQEMATSVKIFGLYEIVGIILLILFGFLVLSVSYAIVTTYYNPWPGMILGIVLILFALIWIVNILLRIIQEKKTRKERRLNKLE